MIIDAKQIFKKRVAINDYIRVLENGESEEVIDNKLDNLIEAIGVKSGETIRLRYEDIINYLD